MPTDSIISDDVPFSTGKARLVFKGNKNQGRRDPFRRFFGFESDNHIADNPLMAPLYNIRGIVFPYSPGIIWDYAASYSSIEPMHSNFAYPAYSGTRMNPAVVSFVLVSDTHAAARYNLAVFHFLRSVMKMRQHANATSFGALDSNGNPVTGGSGPQAVAGVLPGTPPPVLEFSAYGDYMLNKVPVVVETLAVGGVLPEKQMVDVEIGGVADEVGHGDSRAGFRSTTHTQVPIDMEFSITLRPAYNPETVRKQFDTRKYARGELPQFKSGFQ